MTKCPRCGRRPYLNISNGDWDCWTCGWSIPGTYRGEEDLTALLPLLIPVVVRHMVTYSKHPKAYQDSPRRAWFPKGPEGFFQCQRARAKYYSRKRKDDKFQSMS